MVHPIFLLLLLLTPTTTLAQDNTVYDVYFNPLEPDQDYYLVPTTYTEEGGGVMPFPVGSPSCPNTFYVSQEEDNTDFGSPISFSIDSSSITLSSKLQIYFSDENTPFPPSYVTCHEDYSEWWGITSYNSTYIVELNGDDEDAPFFTIEDDPNGNYNINYCYSDSNCTGGLNFINGVNGQLLLGINSTSPMSFVFEPNQFFSPRKSKFTRKKMATM